jgi:capsular exopolysaccharide synthesis family protein
MGIVLGLSLAFLIEYVDNTLKTPDEIEEFLALPSLGVIPTLDEIAASASNGRRLSANGNLGPHPALLPDSEPRSRVWEAYRSLRTSILLSQSDHPPRKMLITSAFAGEGKTTTVANTGIVLAQTGARTIVIDMDMRRSTLGMLFGIEAESGVSNYLSGNSDLTSQIRQTGVPNLYIIPAGPQPPNAAELIGSERMSRLFKLLEDEFQYIVIDSPPVLSVTDAQILAKQVDGVVLVIYGGKTPRDAARKAIQQLSTVGGKVLGGMVNKIDVHRSEYSYYYRYYYDDHYYRQTT